MGINTQNCQRWYWYIDTWKLPKAILILILRRQLKHHWYQYMYHQFFIVRKYSSWNLYIWFECLMYCKQWLAHKMFFKVMYGYFNDFYTTVTTITLTIYKGVFMELNALIQMIKKAFHHDQGKEEFVPCLFQTSWAPLSLAQVSDRKLKRQAHPYKQIDLCLRKERDGEGKKWGWGRRKEKENKR